jgi:ligand-binding SRPBCC domain-containing protein
MDYHHSFTAPSPQEQVLDFHRSSASLGAITPPVLLMRNFEAPDILGEGSTVSFTLWLGPLPVRWQAWIEHVSPAGFDDVQVEGPFRIWVHTHRFEAQPDGSCLVQDHVRFELKAHPVWGPVGALMALGLPLLFAYRARRTKSLLIRSTR